MPSKLISHPLMYLLIGLLVVAVLVAIDRLAGGLFGPMLAMVTQGPAGGEASTDESARANAFFEAAFEETMMRSPMYQAQLGIKTDYDKWDDLSPEFAAETIAIVKRQLKTLGETIDYDQLDRQTQLSYDLFIDDANRTIARYAYRNHDYPINQMFGWQSRIPSFLINYHRIDSVTDAEAYIARLNNLPKFVDQVIAGLQTRADMGVIPPKFVFPRVIPVAENVITGEPFDRGKNSTIFADFQTKVDALAISDDEKLALVTRASEALLTSVGPAFRELIAYLTQLETQATTDDGVWKLPDGAGYYARRLQDMTTTDLSADQIHEIGLREVSRIQNEMKQIMTTVGFEGSLQDFFAFMRDSDQFYYDQTDEGKQAYLDEATAIIDNMRDRLDALFITKPRAEIIVKAVEPFREASAGGAFYQRPAPDGTRPGIYYANLHNMKTMPKYEMESLAYHEGIPGHHMQLSIAIELEDIPTFRKYLGHTAYIEGWGLYAELVPKEIGLYSDPYSDFGRLSAELWRACRLVVDTGIHDKRWTREQAIAYLSDNTPAAEDESVRAIERYIVMPGQATAYKIGMLKILELREMAKTELGDRFDLREFHDVILADGPVPLGVLEQIVNQWIAEKKNA